MDIATLVHDTEYKTKQSFGESDPQRLILSQKRAATVANELVRLGVDSRRIIPVGAGEIEGPEVMPKHRKVMIHIH
jgi:hypothetical protein